MASKSKKKNSVVSKLIVGAVAVILCVLLCFLLIRTILGAAGSIGSVIDGTSYKTDSQDQIYDPEITGIAAAYEEPVETVPPDELVGNWTDDGTGMEFNEIGEDAAMYEEGMSVTD